MAIRNINDLRDAYEELLILEKLDLGATENGRRCIQKIKRDIREYLRDQDGPERIVKDDGIDGYVSLIAFPKSLKSEDKAEEFFNNRYRETAMPSQYDCTGQAFTLWVKFFQRRGRWMAYHSVGFDV